MSKSNGSVFSCEMIADPISIEEASNIRGGETARRQMLQTPDNQIHQKSLDQAAQSYVCTPESSSVESDQEEQHSGDLDYPKSLQVLNARQGEAGGVSPGVKWVPGSQQQSPQGRVSQGDPQYRNSKSAKNEVSFRNLFGRLGAELKIAIFRDRFINSLKQCSQAYKFKNFRDEHFKLIDDKSVEWRFYVTAPRNSPPPPYYSRHMQVTLTPEGEGFEKTDSALLELGKAKSGFRIKIRTERADRICQIGGIEQNGAIGRDTVDLIRKSLPSRAVMTLRKNRLQKI